MIFFVKFYFYGGKLANYFSFNDEKKFLSFARSLRKNLEDFDYEFVNFSCGFGIFHADLDRHFIARDLNKFKKELEEVRCYEL